LKKLHESNNEIRKISKAKDMFFASVSHELRNPLNALLGCIDVLQTSEANYDIEILQTAKICGESLHNLIGNVLDVAKIEAGKLDIVKSVVDLKEIIHKVYTMYKYSASTKGISLKLLIGKKIPDYFNLDPGRLMQVLINLVGNAIKFTERGGIFIKLEWFPTALQQYFRNVQGPHGRIPLISENHFLNYFLAISDRKKVVDSLDGKSHIFIKSHFYFRNGC
jgi:signal transduction histidine kinase